MKVRSVASIDCKQTVWGLDWHPTRPIFAAVGSSKVVSIYEMLENNEWKKTQTIDTDHSKTLRCVRFSNSGKFIAVASFDATLSIYVLTEGLYQHMSTLQGHDYEVKCIAWRDDDKRIASCSRDKNVWVWEFDQISYDYVCSSILEGHQQDVKFVIWADNNTLISASYDNTIKIWIEDDDSYLELQTLQGHSSIVWAIQKCPKTNRLYSVGDDLSVICWSINNNKYALEFKIENVHVEPIYTCVLWGPKYLISGAGDNAINVIDVESKKIIKKIHTSSDINCLRINKSQKWMISGEQDGRIGVWQKQE